MGNKQQSGLKEFEREMAHPRFAKSKIITRQGDTQELQTTMNIDEKEYDKWKASLGTYDKTDSFLLLPRSHTFSRSGFCGNAGTATINYDCYPYLLSEEIDNQIAKKSHFQEPEIWQLLHSLLQARLSAQQHEQRLGDVRPRNVFVNDKRQVRVANSLSWPMENSNVQKALDKTHTYIAPEDLARLSRGEFFDGPSDISEAFSIGLSALSAANLADYEESLYDMKGMHFREEEFGKALSTLAFNQGYSEVLRGAILSLLNLDTARRMPCDQLRIMLEKHSLNILRKENFVVDNAPPRLHDEIVNLRQQLQPVQQPVSLPSFGAPSPALVLPSDSLNNHIQQVVQEESPKREGTVHTIKQEDSPSRA